MDSTIKPYQIVQKKILFLLLHSVTVRGLQNFLSAMMNRNCFIVGLEVLGYLR